MQCHGMYTQVQKRAGFFVGMRTQRSVPITMSDVAVPNSQQAAHNPNSLSHPAQALELHKRQFVSYNNPTHGVTQGGVLEGSHQCTSCFVADGLVT